MMDLDGEILRKARQYLALSQCEAAGRLGVSVVAYQRWEQGKAKPQPFHRRKIRSEFKEAFVALGVMKDKEASELEQDIVVQETENPETQNKDTPVPLIVTDISAANPLLVGNTEIMPWRFINGHMTTHLWSLAFASSLNCDERRKHIRSAIKDFDSMNINNKNYQITRREALYSLASLPLISFHLTTPQKTVPISQYESALAQCAAGLEACFELSKGDHNDISLAFSTLSHYLPLLQAVIRDSSTHRKDAAGLILQSLILIASLSYHLAPGQAMNYAEQAVMYADESKNPVFQVIAYQELSIAHFVANQRELALQTAEKAQNVIDNTSKELIPERLKSWVYAGLAKYQAQNGNDGFLTSLEQAQNTFYATSKDESMPVLVSHNQANLFRQEGMTYTYLGQQDKALAAFGKIIDFDDNNLVAKLPIGKRTQIVVACKATLASLRLPRVQKDKKLSIKLWKTGMEGARALQSELCFNDAYLAYQIMEGIWSDDAEVLDLRDLIVHW